jgi:hypothetical protein
MMSFERIKHHTLIYKMRDLHLRLGKSESLEASMKPVQVAVGPTLGETYPHGAAAYLIDVNDGLC